MTAVVSSRLVSKAAAAFRLARQLEGGNKWQ
jgi:hypothetical protein